MVAPDLPCEDDAAGLGEYTDAVVDAIGDRRDDLVSSPSRSAASPHPWSPNGCRWSCIVLVTAMVPRPGETGSEWWVNTRLREAVADQGLPAG